MKNSKSIVFVMKLQFGCRFDSRVGVPILAHFEVGDAQFLGIESTSGALLLGAITFFMLSRHQKLSHSLMKLLMN